MTAIVMQVFEIGTTDKVFAFTSTDATIRFVVGSPDDVGGETLPGLWEMWQRATISPDKEAPGLRVRYMVGGKPADEDVTYDAATGHVSATADAKCYLCVCRPGAGSPVCVVFGSFRGRDWLYDPYTGEVATIAKLWLEGDSVWYTSSGVSRKIISEAVFDYSTGARVHATAPAGVGTGSG